MGGAVLTARSAHTDRPDTGALLRASRPTTTSPLPGAHRRASPAAHPAGRWPGNHTSRLEMTTDDSAPVLPVYSSDQTQRDRRLQSPQSACAAARRYGPRAFIAVAGTHTIVVPVIRAPRRCRVRHRVSPRSRGHWQRLLPPVAASGWPSIDAGRAWTTANPGTGHHGPPPTSVQSHLYTVAGRPADVKGIKARAVDVRQPLRSSTTTVGQFTEGEQYAAGGADPGGRAPVRVRDRRRCALTGAWHDIEAG